jgi:hypothetical protein
MSVTPKPDLFEITFTPLDHMEAVHSDKHWLHLGSPRGDWHILYELDEVTQVGLFPDNCRYTILAC